MNESKVERLLKVGGSLNKRLLFIINYHDCDMCCFKRNMSASKRLIDLKACCPFSFLLKILAPRMQDKNTKSITKPKNHPKSRTLRELEKLDID